MEISEIIKYFSDSKEIISAGLWAVTFVVYAENGLFFAFFLPGDYLLFLTGVFVGTAIVKYALVTVLLYLFLAAVLGSFTGFLFGRFFGSNLENRPARWYFKKKHIKSTEEFFEKYGNQALIISRFLPYVRTFAPILAGISKMNYSKFLFLNLVGSALWVGSLVGAGCYFGRQFPWIINYVHYIILFFLGVTTFTVIKGYLSVSRNENSPKS
jgi:membrane-associated protein